MQLNICVFFFPKTCHKIWQLEYLTPISWYNKLLNHFTVFLYRDFRNDLLENFWYFYKTLGKIILFNIFFWPQYIPLGKISLVSRIKSTYIFKFFISALLSARSVNDLKEPVSHAKVCFMLHAQIYGQRSQSDTCVSYPLCTIHHTE